MSDYAKAMKHIELACRRLADDLRRKGETCIEDALHDLADEIAKVMEQSETAEIDAASR